MAPWRRRRGGGFAGWLVTAAAGLGAGAAVLALLEPGRRERARRALDRAGQRTGEVAREVAERLGAAGAELPRPEAIERRPGLLGGILVARSALGGGVLRIPFALLGLATLARTAASTERGRAAIGTATRAVHRASEALRGVSASLASP